MLGTLTSERLQLRDVRVGDAEAFFELNQDPEVMRFLGGVREGDDLEHMRALLAERLAGYARCPGLGLGACFLRATSVFIGWFMLRPRTYREREPGGELLAPAEHAELGYRLARRFWGQGLATEMSLALVRYGFEQLGLPQIVAFVSPEHHGSARVLQKAGLRRAARARYDGEDLDLYRIVRPEAPA